MKKTLALTFVALTIALLAGCSSISENCNLTGTWKYTFEENGKTDTETGSMSLTQSGFTLSGKANDAFGEFLITGSNVAGSPHIVIDGTRNDGNRTFHFIGQLSSDNEFEGTYTTNQNTAGTLEAQRVVGN